MAKDKAKDVDYGRWVTEGKKPYSNVKVPDANKKAIEEMNKKKKGK
jgi:hypothetical protein